jgi:hypothetical protein
MKAAAFIGEGSNEDSHVAAGSVADQSNIQAASSKMSGWKVCD